MKDQDDYLNRWWHNHIVLWAVLAALLISLIFSWCGYVFTGSVTRALCAAMILLRTVKKEKEKRKYRKSKSAQKNT